jgi:integrase
MATIRKRGDLQWEAQIRKKGFAHVQKTFTTRVDAELWGKTTESEMGRGVFENRAEAEETTLRESIERYMTEVSSSKKGVKAELVRFRWWLNDPLANRSLASLKGSDFAKWRDKRLKTVAPATARRDLSVISHLFTICRKEWGINVQNPIENIRMPSVRNARERRLDGDEEERLLAALSDSGKGDLANHWMHPLVAMAIETAMRQGELLQIEWADVDLKKSHIHLSDTKNGTSRDVPLSNRAKAILNALPRSIGGKVFGTTQSAVVQSWTRACKRADIEGLTFHDLRHEATSRLAEKLALHELMKVTGHKDTKMLARYYHPRAEDLAKKLG